MLKQNLNMGECSKEYNKNRFRKKKNKQAFEKL